MSLDGATPRPYASLVLPVHNQADHIAPVVESFLQGLAKLDRSCELILVPNGCRDASAEICAALAAEHEAVRSVELTKGGWGRAVGAGLKVAHGEVVGYTNSARTPPETAILMLAYAIAYPNALLKATRRVRGSALRKLGSVVYNFECRRLFDLATWDIDGTPKLFPRSFHHLLSVHSNGNLYDLELLRTCQYAGYPVIEIPVLASDRLGGRSTTSYRTAAQMLLGAYRLRGQDARPRPAAHAAAAAASGKSA